MSPWVLWTKEASYGIILTFNRWYGVEAGKLEVPRFWITFKHGSANDLYDFPPDTHNRKYFYILEWDGYRFKRHFWSPIARWWSPGDYDSFSVASEDEINRIIDKHLPQILKDFQKFVTKRGGPEIK